MKNILIIGAIALGFWVLTKYQASQSLTVRAKGIGFDGLKLQLDLGIFNSSLFPVSFTSFNGSVSANGVPLAGVFDFAPVVVTPGIETDVYVDLVPNIQNIIQTIQNLFSSGKNQTLTLQGTLVAENLTLPIQTTFQTIPAL